MWILALGAHAVNAPLLAQSVATFCAIRALALLGFAGPTI